MNAPAHRSFERPLLESYFALKAAEAARDSYQRDGNDTASQRWDERQLDIRASIIEQTIALTGLTADQLRDAIS